jgi:hypothetical protein
MRWLQPRELAKLAEEFANFPDSAGKIVQFTKKYAPLRVEFEVSEAFRFKLDNWRKDQAIFRRMWERHHKKGVGEFDRSGKEEGLAYIGGSLCYTTGNLWGLLSLALLARPRDLLRKCKRPDCPNPYYVAHHRGQAYCSDLCGHWAQRKWKRKWWNEVGKNARSKKARQMKRGNAVHDNRSKRTKLAKLSRDGGKPEGGNQ